MKQIEKIKHLDTLLHYSELLEDPVNIAQYEQELQVLEKQLVTDDIALIVSLAQEKGSALIEKPTVPDTFADKAQAAFYRYLMVPLLYKLGFNQEAAQLGPLI